jgi:hypothetical protein
MDVSKILSEVNLWGLILAPVLELRGEISEALSEINHFIFIAQREN